MRIEVDLFQWLYYYTPHRRGLGITADESGWHHDAGLGSCGRQEIQSCSQYQSKERRTYWCGGVGPSEACCPFILSCIHEFTMHSFQSFHSCLHSFGNPFPWLCKAALNLWRCIEHAKEESGKGKKDFSPFKGISQHLFYPLLLSGSICNLEKQESRLNEVKVFNPSY